MPPHGRWSRRGASALVVVAVAVVATLLAMASPAGAHPFGDPQTMAIALDRDRPEVVHVRWRIGGLDDLTLLGVALGLLPRDRVLLDGAVLVQDSDAATIGRSGRFAAYLLKQIAVASGGRACAGSVAPPSDLARTGVRVDYTCSAPVGTVTIGVRMLTDLNPAYQTLATGPDGQRAVYGSGQYSHRWALGDAPATASARLGRSAAVQVAVVVGGLLLAAVAALVLLRRLGRRGRAVA